MSAGSVAEILEQNLGELLESPRWDPVTRRVSFVDIPTGSVFLHDPGTSVTDRCAPGIGRVSAAVPHGDRFRLVADDAIWDWSPGSVAKMVARLPGDLQSNDAARDPWGAWWVGRMSPLEEPHVGELLRIDSRGMVTRQASRLTIPNGMGWSPDKRTMYFAESQESCVFAIPSNRDGIDWSKRRAVVTLTDAAPDGLCMTPDGFWIGCWEGSRVSFHTFDGHERVRIGVPATQVSACAVVGDDLYITTAGENYGAAEIAADPLAGSLFVVRGATP